MRTVALSKARQKLSELVACVENGEDVGITRRGKLVALMVPARPVLSLPELFGRIEQIRKTARLKNLIEDGRT